MKYGLLVFKETDNVGDDIQSYAASRFLPSVDCFVDREHLNEFVTDDGDAVAVIMNAWYLHNKLSFAISPYIHPLYISMHFAEADCLKIGYDFLSEKVIKAFSQSKYGVGCRDISTIEILKKKGLKNTYFSGCLTLTLTPFNDVEKTNKVYCVDVDDSIADLISSNTDFEVIRTTHNITPEKSVDFNWEARKKRTEDLLRNYQGAKFVVTSRLHCALPCLAIGVPVFLVYRDDEINGKRISDYLLFLRHGWYQELSDAIQEKFWENADDNPEYMKYRDNAISTVKEFVEQAKSENEHVELPENYWYGLIQEMNKTVYSHFPRLFKIHDKIWDYEHKEEWYKQKVAWLECCEQKIAENEQEIGQYKQEIEMLKNTNDQLNGQLQSIVHRKAYRILKKLNLL